MLEGAFAKFFKTICLIYFKYNL